MPPINPLETFPKLIQRQEEMMEQYHTEHSTNTGRLWFSIVSGVVGFIVLLASLVLVLQPKESAIDSELSRIDQEESAAARSPLPSGPTLFV